MSAPAEPTNPTAIGQSLDSPLSTASAGSLAAHQSAPTTRQVWADLSLLWVAAVWGGTFVMVKDALALAGPFTFLAVRFTLASLVLAPLMLARRERLAPRWWLAGALVGVFLFAGYAFQTAGLQYTTPARAGFITGLSVVIVAALAAALVRRLPSLPLGLGVALATLGLALLSGLEVGGSGLQGLQLFGDLLVLACAFAFAFQILALGRWAPRYEALGLTFGQIAAAALLSLALAALLETTTPSALLGILPAALFTGVLATVAAFFIQTRAQRFTTPTHTALIFSTEPVFAALFAYLLIGELLSLRALVGCGLILAGMLLSQWRRASG